MLDPHKIMHELSERRTVFHSEADFQHAYAWLLHELWPKAAIRLEYPAALGSRTSYIDIVISVGGQRIAIELKYKTRALNLRVNGELFALKSHSAQDLGRYDFLRDVERIEGCVQRGVTDRGIAILLTNDSAYWKPAERDGAAYHSFRLHDGRELNGSLEWGSSAGAGTMRGREMAIAIGGQHLVQWHEYSKISDTAYGRLRFVVIDAAR